MTQSTKTSFVLRYDGNKWIRHSGPWEDSANSALEAARKERPGVRFCLVRGSIIQLTKKEMKDGKPVCDERGYEKYIGITLDNGDPLMSEPLPAYEDAGAA